MEEEKKGFVVKDKRGGEQEAQQRDAATEAMKNTGDTSQTRAQPTVEVTDTGYQETQTTEVSFVNFIVSLGTTALFHLGMFPDPETKQVVQNLPAAKQVTDIIAMLQEKTKGNLASEEAAIVEETLYNLRMYYIKTTTAGK